MFLKISQQEKEEKKSKIWDLVLVGREAHKVKVHNNGIFVFVGSWQALWDGEGILKESSRVLSI